MLTLAVRSTGIWNGTIEPWNLGTMEPRNYRLLSWQQDAIFKGHPPEIIYMCGRGTHVRRSSSKATQIIPLFLRRRLEAFPGMLPDKMAPSIIKREFKKRRHVSSLSSSFCVNAKINRLTRELEETRRDLDNERRLREEEIARREDLESKHEVLQTTYALAASIPPGQLQFLVDRAEYFQGKLKKAVDAYYDIRSQYDKDVTFLNQQVAMLQAQGDPVQLCSELRREEQKNEGLKEDMEKMYLSYKNKLANMHEAFLRSKTEVTCELDMEKDKVKNLQVANSKSQEQIKNLEVQLNQVSYERLTYETEIGTLRQQTNDLALRLQQEQSDHTATIGNGCQVVNELRAEVDRLNNVLMKQLTPVHDDDSMDWETTPPQTVQSQHNPTLQPNTQFQNSCSMDWLTTTLQTVLTLHDPTLQPTTRYQDSCSMDWLTATLQTVLNLQDPTLQPTTRYQDSCSMDWKTTPEKDPITKFPTQDQNNDRWGRPPLKRQRQQEQNYPGIHLSSSGCQLQPRTQVGYKPSTVLKAIETVTLESFCEGQHWMKDVA
ncbi:uncharacterized protein V6R79_026029 [Siganus canaliculatus]